MSGITVLFWLFLILTSLAPLSQKRMLTHARLQLLRRFERQRGSRVISMIHRQETMSFLGFPVRTGLPEEIYELMRLYPQATQRRPSVEYVPNHYHPVPRDRADSRPGVLNGR